MTFSWFNTMEKKKKKRAPYFHHRMSADDLRQKIIELKSRGVTNQIICKDLQIGGSTLYKFLREEGTIRKYLKIDINSPSYSDLEERISVLEMQLEIVINKLKEIYEGNTEN